MADAQNWLYGPLRRDSGMIKGRDLQNREGPGEPGEPPVVSANALERRLAELVERIERARLTRQGEEKHCTDCFRRGRDAALKIIDGL
jgi:hypothetical protein